MKKTLDVEMRKEELRKELNKLEAYESIRSKLVETMQWDCMDYHSADETHEQSWFEEPTEDSYRYEKYIAYKDILETMDKAILG